jgi:GAF domain-containing protein
VARELLEGRVILLRDAADRERWQIKTIPGTDTSQSGVFVPIVGSDGAIGAIVLENYEREHAFGEAQVRLLTTVAASMGVALESARNFAETQRLLKETEQRNAELAVINSIQQGVSENLDFQKIIDLVGDKLREVFKTGDVSIRWWDRETNYLHTPYIFEHGKRLRLDPRPLRPGSLAERVLRERIVGFSTRWRKRKRRDKVVPGTDHPLCTVRVPIVSGDKALGYIMLESYEREYAFGEPRSGCSGRSPTAWASRSRTRASSTRRSASSRPSRSAWPSSPSSTASSRASPRSSTSRRSWTSSATSCARCSRPAISRSAGGTRGGRHALALRVRARQAQPVRADAVPEGGPTALALATRRPQVANTADLRTRQCARRADPGTDLSKCMAVSRSSPTTACSGRSSSRAHERENAFSASQLSLLTTVANSMGVALENARLFDETQRLFKAEQERAAELAVINSIQQGIRRDLDFQRSSTWSATSCARCSRPTSPSAGGTGGRTTEWLYCYEHGKRLQLAPTSCPRGPTVTALTTRTCRSPTRASSKAAAASSPAPTRRCAWRHSHRRQRPGARHHPDRELRARGRVRRVRAPAASTVAASMGIALESARHFDETQRLLKETEQRAAELAVINSIQQGMSAKLDFQSIVDLVGDKLREVFRTGNLSIRWWIEGTNSTAWLYAYEHGKRLQIEPTSLLAGGETEKALKTRLPQVIDAPAARRATLPGTDAALSAAFIPIIGSDRALGTIQIESFESRQAFGEAEIRLLTTVASGMGIALESASNFAETQRLLKETEQRNAELAVINSVQQGMATKLDFQGILDLVGDKLREVLGIKDLAIWWHEERTNLIHLPYCYEHGKRISVEPRTPRPTVPGRSCARRGLRRCAIPPWRSRLRA